MALRRLLLICHGETEAAPGIRFLGSTDLPLSAVGQEQMRRAGSRLGQRPVDGFVATSLKRSWQGATQVSRGANVRLIADFQEIHFGRWEGQTLESVQAADPVLYQDWENGAAGFEFPNGETRAAFQARIQQGLASLEASGASSLAAVLDPGVISEIAHQLSGQSLAQGVPGLGEVVLLTRTAGGWMLGAHSSDPAGLENDAAA